MEARHLLKTLKDDGWYLGDTAGASRQYVHPGRAGVITVCVRYTDHLGPSSVDAARTPATEPVEETPVALESTPSGYSAYCPDLAGCVATGATEDETRSRMAEALALHRAGLARR
jgi:predicted RNA binding protein YcfA (HicA-like mRNA interferase family)